jgi:putative spermidine/putrescine transport system ATP-binding protein
MQVELKQIQREVGLTFIYVTHDQEEALTMSDRLAVFNEGRIEQIGSPAEVYERPATAFVAGFVGTSNVLEGEVARGLVGDPSPFTVRPEKIRILEAGEQGDPGDVVVDGRVRDVAYVGAFTRYAVALAGGGELVVMRQNLTTSSMDVLEIQGKDVRLAWSRENDRAVRTVRGRGSDGPQEGDA